jgi:hypothetical protein
VTSTPASIPTDLANQQFCHPMPLAVYRELAAHLRQVTGVEVELLPQTSQTFDYQQSQVGGLVLHYGSEIGGAERELVGRILAYYEKRYRSVGR